MNITDYMTPTGLYFVLLRLYMDNLMTEHIITEKILFDYNFSYIDDDYFENNCILTYDDLMRLRSLLNSDYSLTQAILHKEKIPYSREIDNRIDISFILDIPMPNTKAFVIGHFVLLAQYYIHQNQPQHADKYISQLHKLLEQWTNEFPKCKKSSLYKLCQQTINYTTIDCHERLTELSENICTDCKDWQSKALCHKQSSTTS